MIEKNEVKRLAEAFLATTENYLVDVEMKPGNLIVVEIDNDEAVCVDDCAALNRYLEEQLGPEVDDYDLEVGSAGITSPFKILRQYQKNVGNEVEMLLKSGVKLHCVLKAATEEGVVVTVAKQVKPEGAKRPVIVEEDVTIKYSETKYTKYLIQFK